MNKKLLYLGMAFVGLFFLSACGCNRVNIDNLDGQDKNIKPAVEKVEIVNFHATQRCVACNNLGSYSEATIYEFFQPELRDGVISFKSINVDLPENKEVAKKYQAVGSSLFINSIYNNEDHIDEDVRGWRLLNDQQQFKNYLKNRINLILNK